MTDQPNFIFVVIDTLRKDYAKPIEELLKEFDFITYDRAIAPSPWTSPSHASMFTGLYPLEHGTHETRSRKDWDVRFKGDNILISHLKDLGYTTFLISANPHITPRFGFKGFDHFFDSWNGPTHISVLKSNEEKRVFDLLKKNDFSRRETALELLRMRNYELFVKTIFHHITRKVLDKPYQYVSSRLRGYPMDKGIENATEYIKNSRKIMRSPFFLFINLMEVHEPYYWGENSHNALLENLKTNASISPNLLKKWKELYPKEVEYVCKKLKSFINVLKEQNIFDNTLIIVTSDHGQLLGEHGRISHGTFLYDELLNVPLLIKYPAGCNTKISPIKTEYISIKQLAPFIINIAEGKSPKKDILYSRVVFSESYGIQNQYEEPKTALEKKNIIHLEKYRIAIFYKSYKGVFNVNDWRFEEVVSYESSVEISNNIREKLEEEVIKFLKTNLILKKLRGQI